MRGEWREGLKLDRSGGKVINRKGIGREWERNWSKSLDIG